MSACTNIYNRHKMNSRITDNGYFDPEGYEYDTRAVVACHDCMFHIYHDSCMIYKEKGLNEDSMREQYRNVSSNKYCDYFLMKNFSEGDSEDEEIRAEVLAIAKRKNYPSEYWARVSSSSSSSSGSGSGCFPKGTLISTRNGLKCISTLNKGDFVTTLNKKNEKSQKRILKTKKYNNKPLWELSFSDGQLKTTQSHSFLKNKKWTKALNLSVGDKILCFTKGKTKRKEIIRSCQLNQTEEVYNIIVEDNFTFLSDGVLSHSFTHFRRFRELYWSVYGFISDRKMIFIPEFTQQLKGE